MKTFAMCEKDLYNSFERYLIESPRWYLSQARAPEAEAVLHYIARGQPKQLMASIDKDYPAQQ